MNQPAENQDQPFDTTSCLHDLVQSMQPLLIALHKDFRTRNKRYKIFEQILYIFGIIIAIVSAYVFYLVYTVTMDMGKVSNYMASISSEIVILSHNVSDISQEMRGMRQAVQNMNQSTHYMNHATQQMTASVDIMQNAMEYMKISMIQVAEEMGYMHKSMQQISANMSHLHTDISEMSQDFKLAIADLNQITVYMGEMKDNTQQMGQDLHSMSYNMNNLSRHVVPTFNKFNNIMPFMPW